VVALFWIIGILPIPALFKQIASGILGIIVLIWLVQFLIRIFPALNIPS